MDTKCEKPVVLVSGFGPFGGHPINASWSGVQELLKLDLPNKLNIKIVAVEIPVVYEKVDKLVPSLWKTHSPKLVIHVGVSAQVQMLTLEVCANGHQYRRFDCDGKRPPNSKSFCCEKKKDRIQCGLDVPHIVNVYNKLDNPIQAVESGDAGRFLCEYTYYTSLRIDPSRTLFVHVPDLTEKLTAHHIALGLGSIIELCLQQLR